MDSTTIPRAQLLNARALLAELKRQANTGKPGPYVAPDGDSATDEGDLTSVVIDGRVDLVALASVVEGIIREDRTSLFVEVDELTDKICEVVQDLPYKVAASAMRHIEAITAAVCDPLGEHFGDCFLCEEPIFVQGRPDDDCESAGDEYCHRTCGDQWRKDHPGERTHVDTDGDE